MNTPRQTLIIISLTSLTPTQLIAQTRPDRLVHRAMHKTGYARVVALHEPGSTTLRISERFLGSPPAPVVEVPLSITRVGDVAVLPGADEILVSGLAEGNGPAIGRIDRLTRVSPGGSFQLTDSYVQAGADFVGVAYSPAMQQLFALDGESKQILAAPYTPGTSIPQSYSVVASPSDLGVLTSPLEHQLAALETGELLVFHSEATAQEDTFLIDLGPPTVVQRFPGEKWTRVFFTQRFLEDGQTSISVHGPPNVGVEVLRADQGFDLIASGTTNSSGQATLNTITSLEMGGIYVCAVSYASAPSPPYKVAVTRWGDPESLNLGCDLMGFSPGLALRAFLGNAAFRIPLHVNCPAQYQGTTSLPAVLMAGTEANVQNITGTWILQGPVSFSRTLILDSSRAALGIGITGCKVDLPIPNDPALVGAIGCYQWVVFEAAGPRVTEILGIAVRELPFIPFPDSMAMASGSSSRVSRPPSARDKGRALVQWWVSAGGRHR